MSKSAGTGAPACDAAGSLAVPAAVGRAFEAEAEALRGPGEGACPEGGVTAARKPAFRGPARPGSPASRAPRTRSGGLRAGSQLAVLYAGCVLLAGAYGLALLLPADVKAAGGSQALAGLIYWCGALGACGALVLSGRLTERAGAAKVAALGAGLYMAASGILASCGVRSGSAYAAGVLLGAGWALAFTSAPIAASAMAGPARASTRFLILAGCNAAGMGAGPIAGQLLVSHGVSFQRAFALAAGLSVCAGALFGLLARLAPPAAAAARTSTQGGVIGPVRLILASAARPFLLMAGLGACVFAAMTTGQAAFAASRGLNPSIFYACYTLGVIIPRFTVTSLLTRCNPGRAATTLLAGMCLSLAGFAIPGRDPALYAASSLLLGATYGLVYPLIQAGAADRAPGGLRHWTLWYFSITYFAGVYGFPLIASAVTALGGYPALITALLAIAALELTVSIKAQQQRQRAAPGGPRLSAGRYRQAGVTCGGWPKD